MLWVSLLFIYSLTPLTILSSIVQWYYIDAAASAYYILSLAVDIGKCIYVCC